MARTRACLHALNVACRCVRRGRGGGWTRTRGGGGGSVLSDMLNGDLQWAFPELTPLATVTIVQSADHLLNTYATSISEFTEKQ